MALALNKDNPRVRLLSDFVKEENKRSYQDGYCSIFKGVINAIRNPRSHENGIREDLELCLEHLAIISHLHRVLDKAEANSE